jgi:hypothetical protein
MKRYFLEHLPCCFMLSHTPYIYLDCAALPDAAAGQSGYVLPPSQ